MSIVRFSQKKFLGLVLASAVTFGFSLSMASAQTELFKEDFESRSTGSSFTGGVNVSGSGGYNNSKCARANYTIVRQSGTGGSNRMVRNFTFSNSSSRSTTLNYRIKFENDWTTTLGGKYLGIGPTNFITGGKNTVAEGWSARVVFDDRVPYIYIYDQDKSQQFGRKVAPFSNTKLAKNTWHTISLYVNINSAGSKSDGLVELHVNGTKRAEFKNVRFHNSTVDKTRARTFLFHTFLGGISSGTFDSTQHVLFDDIYVRTGRTIR